MRSSGRLASTAVCVALLGLGCSPSDHVDLVHDLRLLAMKAQPPNEVLPVVLLPDGGAEILPQGLGPTDAGAPPALLTPMAITALVADPDGAGRPITYQFAVCAQQDSSTHRCLPSSPDFQVLGAGTAVPPDEKSVEITATFTPTIPLLADAIELDVFHGIDGLNIPIELDVNAGAGDGGETDQGIKLVVFTFPSLAEVFSGMGQLPAPFINPSIPDVAVDGTLWDPPDAGLVLNEADAMGGGGQGIRAGAGGASSASTAGFQFYPVPVAGGETSYSLPTFTGGTMELKESWRYHFYGTAGTFSPAASGGYNTAMAVDNPVDSLWAADKSDPEQDVWFWIVVDNGRGGTDWLSRRGHYLP